MNPSTAWALEGNSPDEHVEWQGHRAGSLGVLSGGGCVSICKNMVGLASCACAVCVHLGQFDLLCV